MIIVDRVRHVTVIHSATDNHCVHVNYTSIHRDPHVKVGINIDNCGSGAACYCDTFSDRQPLCACQLHFYPQGPACKGK